MNLAQLHDTSGFVDLFVDPRFVALTHYMREHIAKPKVDGMHAEALIFRGGFKDGWLDAINEMQALAKPPPPEIQRETQQLYAGRR